MFECDVVGETIALSSQQILHYVTLDIRQPVATTGVAIGEFLVIETHEMKDRGMKVMDVHGFFDGAKAVLVGPTVNDSRLHRWFNRMSICVSMDAWNWTRCIARVHSHDDGLERELG